MLHLVVGDNHMKSVAEGAHPVLCSAALCCPAVVPVIIDEVDAARREKKLASNAGDPDAKIKALKKEFQAAREKE